MNSIGKVARGSDFGKDMQILNGSSYGEVKLVCVDYPAKCFTISYPLIGLD